MMRKTHSHVCSHLMSADGTGCAIDGTHHILFNEADFTQVHKAPVPLMSLTNFSWNCKEANFQKVVDHEMTSDCMNDFQLDTTICLETTRDIEIGEALVWDHAVH